MDNNNNPLADNDPITQYRRFKKNVRDLNNNIKEIVKNIKPLVKAGLTNSCNISKMISDKICQTMDVADRSMDNLDLTDIIRKNSLQKASATAQYGGNNIYNYIKNFKKYSIILLLHQTPWKNY